MSHEFVPDYGTIEIYWDDESEYTAPGMHYYRFSETGTPENKHYASITIENTIAAIYPLDIIVNMLAAWQAENPYWTYTYPVEVTYDASQGGTNGF